MQIRRLFSRRTKALTMETINPHIIEAKYAVRGKIIDKMGEMKREIANGTANYKFDEFCETNIGNPQYFKQKPLTFFRETISAVINPELIQRKVYSEDVNRRAQEYLDQLVSAGAYTDSGGFLRARQSVVEYIENRDGIPADPNNIYLTNGASDAISGVMKIINNGPETGFMIPIPQYPIYSAEVALNGNKFVGYYLNEEAGWQLDYEDLVRSYEEATAQGTNVKAIIVINPGNPTGNIFNEESLQKILKFAYEHGLAVLSDEVYQVNIYDDNKEFISMKKALNDMEPEIANQVELFSFHSCSKGVLGECGLRGGYVETVNIDPEVEAQFLKFNSISLCANTPGQVCVDLMVRPPTLGNESAETVEQYNEEFNSIFGTLKSKAKKLEDVLGTMKGVTTQPVEGALYAFPQIDLPQRFIDEANTLGREADLHYCMIMLEELGLVCVPGSGFKQRPGTWHFRTTILPLPVEKFNQAFDDLKVLNDNLMDKYSN